MFSLVCRVLTFNDFGQTSNMAGSVVSGMVNLAGSEKCYGNKRCMKLMVSVLFGTYQDRRAWNNFSSAG